MNVIYNVFNFSIGYLFFIYLLSQSDEEIRGKQSQMQAPVPFFNSAALLVTWPSPKAGVESMGSVCSSYYFLGGSTSGLMLIG